MNQETEVFATGVKSETVLPYADVPFSAIEALAGIFGEGRRKYGKGNWRKGAGDKPYQEERLHHALRHLGLWGSGDRSENHLAKVMWFCATQIELERIERIGDRFNCTCESDVLGRCTVHPSVEERTPCRRCGHPRYCHTWTDMACACDACLCLRFQPADVLPVEHVKEGA